MSSWAEVLGREAGTPAWDSRSAVRGLRGADGSRTRGPDRRRPGCVRTVCSWAFSRRIRSARRSPARRRGLRYLAVKERQMVKSSCSSSKRTRWSVCLPGAAARGGVHRGVLRSRSGTPGVTPRGSCPDLQSIEPSTVAARLASRLHLRPWHGWTLACSRRRSLRPGNGRVRSSRGLAPSLRDRQSGTGTPAVRSTRIGCTTCALP